MDSQKILNQIRFRRKKRTKAKIFGIADKPRLSIFRSNRYTYAQLIDDEKGRTLVSASTRELKSKVNNKQQTTSKVKQGEELGELIAKKAMEKGIKNAVFDRGWYKYHGRVKTVIDSARKEGLKI